MQELVEQEEMTGIVDSNQGAFKKNKKRKKGSKLPIKIQLMGNGENEEDFVLLNQVQLKQSKSKIHKKNKLLSDNQVSILKKEKSMVNNMNFDKRIGPLTW